MSSKRISLIDPELRELGFQLISTKHHVSEAIILFIRNFQAGDEQFFATLLDQSMSEDEFHALGRHLNDVFKANPTPAAKNLLVTLYDQGPCSLCRQQFVNRLREIGSLPDWIIHECRYDANKNIRLAIRQ